MQGTQDNSELAERWRMTLPDVDWAKLSPDQTYSSRWPQPQPPLLSESRDLDEVMASRTIAEVRGGKIDSAPLPVVEPGVDDSDAGFGTEYLEESSSGAGFGSDLDPGSGPRAIHDSVKGYDLIEEIGRGGMGVIYRGKQRTLRREVAIKRLNEKFSGLHKHPGAVADDLLTQAGADDMTRTSARATRTSVRRQGARRQARERFINEAVVTGLLDHPNIVPVHELGETEHGDAFLSMKLVGGASWKGVLKQDREAEMSPERFLQKHLTIFLGVTNAIGFAHSKGIVHLDIKPDNVMIGDFGEVLVMDWGLAVSFDDELRGDVRHCSTIQSPCGTPTYLPPEMAAGDGEAIGPHSDIYQLGGVLFEVLSGKAPRSGKTLWDVLVIAEKGELPAFPPEVPKEIREICRLCMAKEARDRYTSVEDLQEAIRAYLRHRESHHIAGVASAALKRCEREADRMKGAGGFANRSRLYAEFADAVAGFRQAQLLWRDNREAADGEHQARLAFARTALLSGDIGLAEAHASRLDAARPGGEDIRRAIIDAKVDRGQKDRRLRRRQQQRLALLVIFVGGLLGAAAYAASQYQRAQNTASLARDELRRAELALEVAEQAKADEQTQRGRAEAASRNASEALDRVLRLSDVQRLDNLVTEADRLWPATMSRAPYLQQWLDRARELAGRLPQHRRGLAELRESGREVRDEFGVRWRFPDEETQWQHDTLTQLVNRLGEFTNPDGGALPSVQERLSSARQLYERSIAEQSVAWARAVASIRNRAECPAYEGLEVAPIEGLVPLGRNPASGLWEFWHLQSGDRPLKGAGGQWVVDEGTGVVMVLIPGGRFRMGAVSPATSGRRVGEANVDSFAKPDESDRDGKPVVVDLEPFLIAKYELTQGQWVRYLGTNPSEYGPRRAWLGQNALRHPVESVSWDEAYGVCLRLGLGLPTEAQWEFAARGGTATPYPSGAARESLRGHVNLADAHCKSSGGQPTWRYDLWLDDGHTVHAPVGSFLPNPYGLHDVLGNVWEWCQDTYAPYDFPAASGSGERRVPGRGAARVLRGGSWIVTAEHARSAARQAAAPETRNHNLGVRPALSLPKLPN